MVPFFPFMEEVVEEIEPWLFGSWLVNLLVAIRGFLTAIREYLLDLALYGEPA